jgi:ABC-type Fe3+-citrate transport system substrate-binding protein
MKQQGNSSPLKANFTTKDLNNSEEEEIANIKSPKIIVRMINELKEETQKLVSELKEDMNKQLRQLKEDSNK